jgi:hypothetical protein
MAQSVTRRAALKKFSVALAGMALACFGMANKVHAGSCKPGGSKCGDNSECCSGYCYYQFNPDGKNNATKHGTCAY